MGDQSLPNIGGGHKDVGTGTYSEHSETTWSGSSNPDIAEDIITFNKNHFIVQDLGVVRCLLKARVRCISM